MSKRFQRFLRFDVLDLPRNFLFSIVRLGPLTALFKTKCGGLDIVNLTTLSHEQIETFVLDALAALEEHDGTRLRRVLRFIRGIHFTEGAKSFWWGYHQKPRIMCVDLTRVLDRNDREASAFALAHVLVFTATYARLRQSMPFPSRQHRGRYWLVSALEGDRFLRKLGIFLPDLQEAPPDSREILRDLLALLRGPQP